jgi:hypothetical protein
MKSSSRMLIGFGIAIAVLIVVTVVLVFTMGQGSPTALPENTPQGTVQKYLKAVQARDYTTAYNLLAPVTDAANTPKQSFDSYAMSAQNNANSAWKASLGTVNESGTTATVEITVEVFRAGGPFNNAVNSHTVSFFLKKTGAEWLITAPLDLYWLY